MKFRLVRALQRFLLNPPVKALFRLGIMPPGYALLETIGRRSGRRRRTPVGDGLIDHTFWIIAEHGDRAAYVQNLRANPRVRLLVRRGLTTAWRAGTATIASDDDPYERQRQLAATGLARRLNTTVVRMMGTDLKTIRVDLDR
jgi:deazaflavin-dependent oxidoreductase (nitroreductase family)